MTVDGPKVISAKRSKLMTDRWSDPTKGADGLTFRERRQKAAHDQRERELQRRKGGDAPAEVKKTEGDPTPTPSSPGAEPGHPPTPPAKSERRGYTPGRAWR